jgi:hypothetical protein
MNINDTMMTRISGVCSIAGIFRAFGSQLGLFFYLQIRLHPVRGRYTIFFFEGGVEDGFALEPGALRDSLDGGGQVSAFA